MISPRDVLRKLEKKCLAKPLDVFWNNKVRLEIGDCGGNDGRLID